VSGQNYWPEWYEIPTPWPTPAWFATNANAGVVMRKLLALQVELSWAKLPGLMAALKG
jgi:hypothetical protein